MAELLPAGATTMRLDKFLWFARLAKTRSVAQELIDSARLRIDGRLVERAAAPVRVGDTLTFVLHGNVRVVRILALPVRRGPASEARTCYDDLAQLSPKNENVSHQAEDD